MNFAVEIPRLQLEAGRHFVIENPQSSAAWRPVMPLIRLQADPRVFKYVFDQCMFGLTSRDGQPHKKSTTILTSSIEIFHQLDGIRCDRSHEHARVIGGRNVTVPVGHYPRKLADGIVRGAESCYRNEQLATHDALVTDGEDGVEPESRDAEDSDSDSNASETHAEFPPSFSQRVKTNSNLTKGKLEANQLPACDPGVLRTIKNMHINTGHRPRKMLVRALRIAGAPAEAIRAAKTFKCAPCDETAKPQITSTVVYTACASLWRSRTYGSHSDPGCLRWNTLGSQHS